MPILPSGQIVGITSERARYHAARLNIRVTPDTPHHELYQLVDIIYVDDADSPENWSKNYKFTGHTVSDRHWLMKWKPDDRDSFLDWIRQDPQFHEIESARKKLIYDTLPHEVKTYDYPERFYSILRRRIAAMQMPTASASHWRNTILNMRKCGVREEEINWSGVFEFLSQAEATRKTNISRVELLSRIDFSDIRIELTNELVRDKKCHLAFDGIAEIMPFSKYSRSGIRLIPGELAVLRFVDSLLNYRVAYIRSYALYCNASVRWVVLDPYGKALTDAGSSSVIYFSDSTLAMDAASEHARSHLGLKGALRPGDKYEYMSLHGGEDYREWMVTLPDYQQSHFTAHFTERNVLLHFRTKTRHDKYGNRLLFIEEIQSDWHQQAARKGFANRWHGKIPDAPFQKEWTLLAIKLLLMHAVDGGYDGIAWTPGHIQQIRYQCELNSLRRLYDREIHQYLMQLSRNWGGCIDKTFIETKESWLTPRRVGEYWMVRDREGRFATRKRLSKQQAIAICNRHRRTIELAVPVFHIPRPMRRKIANDAFPLFGETIVDKAKKPLCGSEGFKTCDARTKNACMLDL